MLVSYTYLWMRWVFAALQPVAARRVIEGHTMKKKLAAVDMARLRLNFELHKLFVGARSARA